MKTIILAGGKGTRLPVSAKDKPKPLVPIGDKPILQHQIDLLRKYDLKKIRLSLCYLADYIIDYIKNLEVNEEDDYEYLIEKEPLGTGGAIKFASQGIEEDFMVFNGDILSDINLTEFIKVHQLYQKTHDILASMVIWHCQDARPYGLIKLKKDGRVLEFKEKPSQKQPGYINAGIYILSPKIFEIVPHGTFSMEHEIFPKLALEGKLGVYIHDGYWTDVGTEERLAEARDFFSQEIT